MLTPAVSAVHNSIALIHIHRNMHYAGTLSLSLSPNFTRLCHTPRGVIQGALEVIFSITKNIAVQSNSTPPRDFSSHAITLNESCYRRRGI